MESIRPIAVCIIRRGEEILVGEGYDRYKDEKFFRPLGGAIKFGEFSTETIYREFDEEIGVELCNLYYLTTVESIFTYEGQSGHEIIQIYEGAFVNRDLYERDEFVVCEYGRKQKAAVWKNIDEFLSDRLVLYPKALKRFL